MEGIITAEYAAITMKYIHQLPGWPKFAWNSEALTGLLAEVRHKQGRHIGKMEALGFELRQEAGLNILTTEVVKSSAIEGEKLNPEEVRSSIAKQLGLDVAGLPKASREVEGIVELMLDATRNFEAELSKERLFDWHAALFPTGRIGMSRIVVGNWRSKESGPMQVVSGPLGDEHVHFEAPEASRLGSEMEQFIQWFNSPPSLDPVLKAAVAHLWFLTIHPFEDGNGRIGRAIADMALSQADGTKNRFYSMSAGIEAERKDYYRQLETAQGGTLDITLWLTWFLECLGRTIDNAEGFSADVLSKAKVWELINRQSLNERQLAVLTRMMGNWEGYLTNAKYAKLAKCSSDTALRDIRDLLERGILIKNEGGGRSTSYRLAEV